MLRLFPVSLLALLLIACPAPLELRADEAPVGQPAPEFELTDQDGSVVKLSDLRGSPVVLEWVNPDCPYVKRHYSAGTMSGLARKYAEKGVKWLAINSTHYMSKEDDREFRAAHDLPYPILDDRSGQVGLDYHARSTPHMFVIDAEGVLRYSGAIDDDKRGDKDSPANHVDAALSALLAGDEVPEATTTPYGCSVKYGK